MGEWNQVSTTLCFLLTYLDYGRFDLDTKASLSWSQYGPEALRPGSNHHK